MTEPIPTAITAPKKGVSIVWLIPLLALALGGWLTFKYLQEKGVTIEIEFNSATGLAAGKTPIKYRDVEIGRVDEVAFSADLEKVIVTATINREMSAHLTDETRFWVVRARVAAGEVSGLETLLSGAYIGMEPGSGERKRKFFKGLDKPPVLFTENQGSRYHLQSRTLHSFEPGAPVYYRRLKVGEVIDYALTPDGSMFDIEIFVQAPYNRLVSKTTLFWNASGVNLAVGANGLVLNTESLVSVLLGGIAFDNNVTPQEGRPVVPADPGSRYILYKNREAAHNSTYKPGNRLYRVYFDGSARGLNIGAPVTLRGITVGRVTDISLEYDLNDSTFKIPVDLEFEPERISVIGAGPMYAGPTAEELVRRGLRAQLRSGNLLTGQMLINLDVYPELDFKEVYYEGQYAVLPTIPSTIDSLIHNAGEIVDKLSKLPIEAIGRNLNALVASASDIVQSPQLQGSLDNIEQLTRELGLTVTEARGAVGKIDELIEGVDGLVQSGQAEEILSNLQSATGRFDRTLAELETTVAGFQTDSDAYQAMLRLMHELSTAARSLRQMADYLERHPEALIKGKGN